MGFVQGRSMPCELLFCFTISKINGNDFQKALKTSFCSRSKPSLPKTEETTFFRKIWHHQFLVLNQGDNVKLLKPFQKKKRRKLHHFTRNSSEKAHCSPAFSQCRYIVFQLITNLPIFKFTLILKFCFYCYLLKSSILLLQYKKTTKGSKAE